MVSIVSVNVAGPGDIVISLLYVHALEVDSALINIEHRFVFVRSVAWVMTAICYTIHAKISAVKTVEHAYH